MEQASGTTDPGNSGELVRDQALPSGATFPVWPSTLGERWEVSSYGPGVLVSAGLSHSSRPTQCLDLNRRGSSAG